MTADRPARFRRRSLLAAAVVVAALGAAAVAVADRDRVIGRDLVAEVEPQVTVLTRNLYNGTGVGAVFAASSESSSRAGPAAGPGPTCWPATSPPARLRSPTRSCRHTRTWSGCRR